MAVNQFFIIACQKKKIKKLEEELAKHTIPPNFKIAKYRKDGNTQEWWVTNFTMQQVEVLLEELYIENATLRKQIKKLEEQIEQHVKIEARLRRLLNYDG